MPVKVSFTTANRAVLPPEAIKEIALSVMPSPEAMLYAGARQITRIRTRTEQGVNVDRQPFVPYSKAYAKLRVKRGRKTRPVDLTMSGRMLGSLQAEVESPTSFSIAVTDATAAVYGKAHNEGLGNVPERRWFDTSDFELAEMQKDLIEFGAAARP